MLAHTTTESTVFDTPETKGIKLVRSVDVAFRKENKKKSSKKSNMGDNQRGTRVYVGNLIDTVKKEDLEDEFTKYGKLNSVWVALNPPGKMHLM